MKSLINFRTAILCCACCLCGSFANAQEIVIDFGNPNAEGTTGNLLDAFDGDQTIFEVTLNEDMISNSNVLIDPITVAVPEAGDAGLEITLVTATATTGIDTDFFAGAEINLSLIHI